MKKSVRIAIFTLFSAALFAQETADPTQVKDLYPLGEGSLPDDTGSTIDDSLSDLLDGLELTEEEKKLLQSPDDEASSAGTDNTEAQPEDSTPEEEAEAASEDESSLEAEELTEETEDEVSPEASAEEENSSEKKSNSPAGVSDVPPKKRPKPIDEEKAKAAADKDENDEVPEENKKTIKYGLPSEITKLIDNLMTNDDPRFTEEIYDLFEVSENVQIQQKILEYFGKLEDPCLENFAVTVLNDPYDTKTDVVKACFEYIQKVHTDAAIPAVFTILESDNETYFNDTLSTIGEIGDAKSALSIAEYLERDDLSDAQRQTLMRTLGKLHAVETFDKIVAILENEDENAFVRMYAAEALGLMGKMEAVPVLINTYKDANPNLRQYAIKGLGEFPQDGKAQACILQGIRDEHWKVRQEAINVSKKILDYHAIPYLMYRAENDSERIIKEAAISALPLYNEPNADKFLKDMLEKKVSDNIKVKVVIALLDAEHGEEEILALAEKCLSDVRMKNLAKGIGNELAKRSKHSYEAICLKYLESKDGDLQNIGLDMYKNYKFSGPVEEKIRSLALDRKGNGSVRNRAKKMLGIEDEAKKEEEKKD
ncbi:PBS lyase HEAT-like repeat-containing protein [Treponema sp. JC4]|uniref:HEAT repeat domain-containing protein n=1 Tax=Treponema sp. JC4 TaxID=1124982 RepID=UPI00025B0DE0|nr:HEAT repeat domain-containing protein [Treponema sp. JC4]EID85379.1 PBS lyase HEAT-like repeat-containing protein [Treponema sp. JC4]